MERTEFGTTYTSGKLYVDGVYLCDTLEDADRNLTEDMSEADIMSIKIKGETCIPYGIYPVTLDIVSSKYSNFTKYPFAKKCGGKIPRIQNVPGFTGILIHPGNTVKDTDGCILVGTKYTNDILRDSRKAWDALFDILRDNTEESLTLEIIKGTV